MFISLFLVFLVFTGLIFFFTSFIRALMLLEVLPLIASFNILALSDGVAEPVASDLFATLVLLTLAGTEAALGLGVIICVLNKDRA